LPAVPAAVAEFDMEAAQLLDGEVYVPTVTFVAKVKATAMELKEEPALVLNEICLPPDLRSLRADPMLSGSGCFTVLCSLWAQWHRASLPAQMDAP